MAPPLLEPQPPSLARQHYRARIRARRKAVKALRIFAWLLLAALLVASWYVAERGLGRRSRQRITEELAKRGVDAYIRRLTLDPFRGLIAQDVRVFDPKDRTKLLASISEVALDLNYAALLHHQPFLNAVDVQHADLTIPLPPNPGLPERVKIGGFRAHVVFPSEQILITGAEGDFAGVRISATGQLSHPAAYHPSADNDEEARRNRIALIQRIVAEIARCTFPAGAPTLQLKFNADLSQPESARATAALRAARVQRGNYEFKQLAADAEWADGKLSITHCDWLDAMGNLTARANWSPRSGEGDLQAHSTLDLRGFLAAFGFAKLAADLVLTVPPTIELSGSAKFGGPSPGLVLIGRITASNFAYQGVPFVSLTSDFAWDGARTMLRNLRLHHASGDLSADVLDAPDDFRLNLESSIDPTALRGFAPNELKKFLGEWEWSRPPSLRLSVRGHNHSPESWTGDGAVAFDRTRFRGVWMNNARADLRFGDRTIGIENFRVARDEGVGTGAAVYDFARKEIRLANVKSTLRPADAIYWVEPKFFKHVVPYKFRHPPNVTVNGRVQFQGGHDDHLELLIDAPTGMDYIFLGKNLPIERVSAKLLFTDNRLQISDLAGRLFEGQIRGGADISLAKNDNHYHAIVALEGLNFPVLTDLYFKYASARGKFGGSYDWTGVGDEARTMRGFGRARVTEGNVFAIPIFGPLSGVLGAIFPGAGYSVAHEANASFTIRDGVIHTDDFKVSGKLFGMVGHGDIHFLDDKLDFDLKISGGGAGALLTPVYNLFEYKGEGSFTKPNWHPKRF